MKDWLVVVWVGVFVSIFVGAYILVFGSRPTSGDPEVWAHFATYLSGTVGVTAVLGTLFAVVRTLGQQQDLVDSQRVMLEKQEEQLEIEYEKKRYEESERKNIERSTAIYLLRSFLILKDFYHSSKIAVCHEDPKVWRILAAGNPITYPYLLFENESELLNLLSNLSRSALISCIGAVAHGKDVNEIIKFPISKECINNRDDAKAMYEISNMPYEIKLKAKMHISQGEKNCLDFINYAESLLAEENEVTDS
jgi:hypothetical protein